MNESLLFFLQLLITGLVIGSVYALVALGWVLIYKSTGVLNLAQGELVLVGAYICFLFSIQLQLPFIVSFILTLIASVVIALLIERLSLRPMVGEPIISTIMVTVGLSSLLRGIVIIIWGTDTRIYPPVFSQVPVYIGPIPLSRVYMTSIVFAAFLLIAFSLFFKYSRTGIAMRAAASHQQAALSMGISVSQVFALSWIIATLVASMGGVILGLINGINISITLMGLKVLPAVVFGGLDSIPGAIIGGITVGVLENLCGGYFDIYFRAGVKEIAPYVFLVLVLIFRPYGLFGKPIIERL